MIIYRDFQWDIVFEMCFCELVEVSEVSLKQLLCITCLLILASGSNLKIVLLIGSIISLILIIPTLPKVE